MIPPKPPPNPLTNPQLSNMLSPKYSATHYFHSVRATLAKEAVAPHTIDLFLDYNCPFSAIMFFKMNSTVIPTLQKKHPNKFQFVFVNVVQPWHTNSVLLNEFAIVAAQLIKSNQQEPESNETFWELSKVLFENKEKFYDTANAEYTRNQIYAQIYKVVAKNLKLPFGEEDILSKLQFEQREITDKQDNAGNAATPDIKYFTRYLRGVGVHMTPSVTVNGILDNSISSANEPEELVKKFETQLN